jgi:hypothetical protein
MRTVARLTDHTAISTGCPATMMFSGARRMAPANTIPAPEAARCFNASRREMSSVIR